MTLDLTVLLQSCFALLITSMGAWSLRTLYKTAELVAVLQTKVEDHDELHRAHDIRSVEHERRISRIEGSQHGAKR